MATTRRVVIIGGGYAGVRVARDVARVAPAENLEVVLVSDSAYHVEPPLFYEVATAYLDRESTHSSELACRGVGAELTELFAHLPVTIHIGRVEQIDYQNRLLRLHNQSSLSFDWLVLAVGTALATYNIPGVNEYAFNVKTLSESLRLRHHIIRRLLNQAHVARSERVAAGTFVVIGGGASGVEMVAEVAHLVRKICRDHDLAPADFKVMLVEGGPHILRETPERWRKLAHEHLERSGVEILVNKPVSAIEMGRVHFADGTHLATQTSIWNGGLMAAPLLMRSHLPLQQWGVVVEPTLQVKGMPSVLAVGDCAVIAAAPVRIPATMPMAYLQGTVAARNIIHLARQEPLESFVYKQRGQLITLGGKKALAVWPSGQRAWLGVMPWVVKRLVSLRYWRWYLSPWATLRLWATGVWVQTQND